MGLSALRNPLVARSFLDIVIPLRRLAPWHETRASACSSPTNAKAGPGGPDLIGRRGHCSAFPLIPPSAKHREKELKSYVSDQAFYLFASLTTPPGAGPG